MAGSWDSSMVDDLDAEKVTVKFQIAAAAYAALKRSVPRGMTVSSSLREMVYCWIKCSEEIDASDEDQEEAT